MPSILERPELEIPDIRQDVPLQQSDEPSSAAPGSRPGLMSTIVTVMASVVSRRKLRAEATDLHREAMETPLDTLAREHPFLYIKALSG